MHNFLVYVWKKEKERKEGEEGGREEESEEISFKSPPAYEDLELWSNPGKERGTEEPGAPLIH